ncbi:hypothetical protein AU074_31260 [Pseudomonas sp. ATCC PTA-122608]|uniref:hypothetical protein n=1 Tax=unclassified Pseudomonas TaxID=196821 RepID=UPI00096BAD9D|nr:MULTISPECIES: hypothetical protein [unclassified Pseudomonas]NIL17297.1 hypothetical protein [Pseudomonas sp. AN3A02]OLY73212.1 hypothetical protein AU074_31260 [Pseudomonas sp. ATCC PTA-122608]
MSICESDWKKFKVLRALALERFHLGVLADAKTISERETLSAEARYRTLYRLTRDRDNDVVRTFNLYSRSRAWESLAQMISLDLLSDSELSVLSEETLSAISYAVRQRYEIEWVAEHVSDDRESCL